MAKGNPFLGNITGSFGDITLSSYRGKTVIRRKCAPKNPRTPKQIYQRMFFATISKSRTALKPIIDHSFEQIPHGVDSLNYFTKRNIALMREGTVYDYAKQTWVNPDMYFSAPKANSFVPNPLIISEGSLSPISTMPHFIDSLPEGAWTVDEKPNLDTLIPFAISFPWATEDQDGTKIDNMLAEQENILPGDYLTAVFISAKKSDFNPSDIGYYPCSLHFVRYKAVKMIPSSSEVMERIAFFPTNVDGDNFEIPSILEGGIENSLSPIFSISESHLIFFPWVDFSDGKNFTFEQPIAGELIEHEFQIPLTKEDIVLAATWIHSRPDADKILTSTQSLLLAADDRAGVFSGYNLDPAFDLWTKHAKAIGEPKYLLEGGDV